VFTPSRALETLTRGMTNRTAREGHSMPKDRSAVPADFIVLPPWLLLILILVMNRAGSC
jgi:hypothetical protein